MAILPVRFCVPFAAFLVRSPSTALVPSTRTRTRTLSSSSSSSSTKMASTEEQQQQQQALPKKKPIVQYIFLRRDLAADWPAGAMAAQAAHVSVAAITQAISAENVDALQYVAPDNLPHMTKYVYGVDNLNELQAVRAAWNEMIQSQSTTTTVDNTAKDDDDGTATALMSYWWVEQPENIPTAFGTWPVTRTNKVSKVIQKLKVSFF
jgi:peptidyl-tRNA hydrolase